MVGQGVMLVRELSGAPSSAGEAAPSSGYSDSPSSGCLGPLDSWVPCFLGSVGFLAPLGCLPTYSKAPAYCRGS